MLAPILGSYVMLRGGVFARGSLAAARTATLGNVSTQFLAIAALILLLTLFIWGLRRLLSVPHELDDAGASPFAAFASRWALFGALAIFLYVGAEVAISSIMINFLHQPRILGESYEHAGRLLGLFYWGGAMAGRGLGSLVLTRVPAHRVLAFAALAALLLCLVVTASGGRDRGDGGARHRLLQLDHVPDHLHADAGAFHRARRRNLGPALHGDRRRRGPAVIAGLTADHAGIALAFFVPAVSYAVIATFAFAGGNTCASRSQPPA